MFSKNDWFLSLVFHKNGTVIEKTHKNNDLTFDKTKTGPLLGAPFCLLTEKCSDEGTVLAFGNARTVPSFVFLLCLKMD